MVLNDVVIPYTWYNVQETNRHFQVVENAVAFTVSLGVGSYHAVQLRDHLRIKLNAASSAYGSGYSCPTRATTRDSRIVVRRGQLLP